MTSLSKADSPFKASVPVLLGYFPLGLAFGYLFSGLGYAWYWAPLMSLFVLAGASQFLAVGMLAAKARPSEFFVATFLINLRIIFYSFAFLPRFRGRKFWTKAYVIFALTDESFSVLSAHKPHEDFDLRLSAYNHAYWVLASAVGALLGARFKFQSSGLEFVLVALFAVLGVEQYLKTRRFFPFGLALGTALVAMALHRPQMLALSMLFSAVVLLLMAPKSEAARV